MLTLRPEVGDDRKDYHRQPFQHFPKFPLKIMTRGVKAMIVIRNWHKTKMNICHCEAECQFVYNIFTRSFQTDDMSKNTFHVYTSKINPPLIRCICWMRVGVMVARLQLRSGISVGGKGDGWMAPRRPGGSSIPLPLACSVSVPSNRTRYPLAALMSACARSALQHWLTCFISPA